MDKMREDFEKWFSAHKPKYDGIDYKVVKQQHWKAWKASRAALVVELPPEHEQAYGAYDGAELRHALKQSGVKYE